MNDLLIRRARLIDASTTVDIAIKDGYIVVSGEGVAGSARQMVDAAGRLVIPSFVDAHTHLDKVFITTPEEGINNFQEAIEVFNRRFKETKKETLIERGRRLLRMALSHGTKAMRTHITIDETIALRGVEAALELKEEFAGKVDLQVIAMPSSMAPKPSFRLKEIMEEALRMKVDGIGGFFNFSGDGIETWLDYIFEIATGSGVCVDIHIHESGPSSVRCLNYLTLKTLQSDYQGKVVASHCRGLASVDEDKAKQTIDIIKEADVSIIIMPSKYLYLMKQDSDLTSLGTSRIRELEAAGINIAYASGNIRDAYRPFGNADMLEEALLTAQILQMGTQAELKNILKMGTYNAAQAIGLDNYGTSSGDKADLVILNTNVPAEAIISQVEKVSVIRNGRVAVRNDKRTDIII